MQPSFLCPFALAAILTASACSFERGREGSGPPGATASVDDRSLFRFEPSQVQLGVLTLGETATRTLTVTNLLPTPLELRAGAQLGPCQLTFPGAIPGGKSGSATLSCRWTTLGVVRERLDVTATDRHKFHQTLEISAQIEPLLGFRPDFVDFDIAFGERATRDVSLFGKLANDEAVTIEDTSDPLVSAALIRQPAPLGPMLRIECKGDRVGMHAGSVRMALPKGLGPAPALSWGCKVKGTLSVEPATPYFNLRQSGDRATTVFVRSTKPGFKVFAARVTDGPFIAELQPRTAAGEYPVVVKVQNRLIPDEARAATGTLLISSNDETEPKKTIPLFGMGHVNKVERPEPPDATAH